MDETVIRDIKRVLQYQRQSKHITEQQYKHHIELLDSITYNDLFLSINNHTYPLVQNILYWTDNYFHRISAVCQLITLIALVSTFVTSYWFLVAFPLMLCGVVSSLYSMCYHNYDTKKKLKTYLRAKEYSEDHSLHLEEDKQLSPVEEELRDIYEQLCRARPSETVNNLKQEILGVYHMLQSNEDAKLEEAEQYKLMKLSADIKGVEEYVKNQDAHETSTEEVTDDNEDIAEVPEPIRLTLEVDEEETTTEETALVQEV